MAIQSNGVYLPLKRWNADDALMGRQINSVRWTALVDRFSFGRCRLFGVLPAVPESAK
jgi:hypothetical protein